MWACPPCGQWPASLSSPSNGPHSHPGLARGQTEARGAAAGDFQSVQGEVGATLPRFLSPLPSVPVPSPSLPFLYTSLFSSPPPFSATPTTEEREQACPVCRSQVELGRVWGLCRKQGCRSFAGRTKSPHTEPWNLASWSWKGAPGPAVRGSCFVEGERAEH